MEFGTWNLEFKNIVMKNLIILSFALLISQGIVQSQSFNSCLPEGITFYSQIEIDNFQVNYPGCTEVAGDVIIRGDDIINLNGLSIVTSIGGNLTIGGGSAWSGSGNPLLTSLTGLANLTSIGDSIYIGYNSLNNLTGLEGLINIPGDLMIEYNSLTSLNGLENLNTIAGALFLIDNSSLTSLNGLESIESIGGLVVSNNSSLVNLPGLENLNTIAGGLYLIGNDSLTSLNGMDSLTFIGENLDILFNSSLSDCDVQGICMYLSDPTGVIEIHDNAIGCNSPEEVEEACDTLGIESPVSGQQSAVGSYPNPTNG